MDSARAPSDLERALARSTRLSRRRLAVGIKSPIAPGQVSRHVALQCYAISLCTMAQMRAAAFLHRAGTAGRETARREFYRARVAARRERHTWTRRGGFLP